MLRNVSFFCCCFSLLLSSLTDVSQYFEISLLQLLQWNPASVSDRERNKVHRKILSEFSSVLFPISTTTAVTEACGVKCFRMSFEFSLPNLFFFCV